MSNIGVVTASMSRKQTLVDSLSFCNLLSYIVADGIFNGDNVFLIPHVTCPSRSIGAVSLLDDRLMAQWLSVQFPEVKIIEPKDIGKLSIVISSRLHACVAALNKGIPTVGLAWGNKFSMFSNPSCRVISIVEAVANPRIVIDLMESLIGTSASGVKEATRATWAASYMLGSVKRYYENKIGNGEIYYAYATNPETRRNGASGGVATAFGAIGCQGTIYHERKPECNGGVAVSLPCNVKWHRNHSDNPIIGLFCCHAAECKGLYMLCGGLPSDYRHKQDGISGIVWNGKLIPLSAYWSKFFNLFYIPKPCRKCNFILNKMADISVGDGRGHPEFAKGVNIIMVRTQKGRELFYNAVSNGKLHIETATPTQLLKSQPYFGIKNGEWTIKLVIFRILRTACCFMSDHDKIFAPIIKLWLKLMVYPYIVELKES